MPRTLSPQTVALVKATVPALEAHGPDITGAMYRRLFRNPDIAALFNQANQDKGTQRLALAHAVLAYARNVDNLPALAPAVERIAQKHVGYAIRPEHYPFVAEALLGAIGDILGEAATPEIVEAWAEAYWFLAELLIEREAAIRSEIEAQPGGWTDWRRFRLASRQAEAEGIVSLWFRPDDGGPVLPHRPGQYLTLRFDAAGAPGLKRNYSISSAPSVEEYRITVKRQGEASAFLHDMPVGTVLEATPPAGDFYLGDNLRRPVILLSGGVGVTPFASMLPVLAEQHRDVPVYHIHGTASPAQHALEAEMQSAAARHGNMRIETFYEAPADMANPGRISLDWLRSNTPLAEADIYLCGPRPFLRYLVPGLRGAGVRADRIHYEFFGPADEQLAA